MFMLPAAVTSGDATRVDSGSQVCSVKSICAAFIELVCLQCRQAWIRSRSMGSPISNCTSHAIESLERLVQREDSARSTVYLKQLGMVAI